MRIHWIRVLVAAVLLEAALVVITLGISLFVPVSAILPFVPPVVFVVSFPFGMWVARKPIGGFVLHGTLVGVVATLIYFAIVIAQLGSLRPAIEAYGPVSFFLANALKILGCVAGAYAAGRGRVSAHA
jgi:hypothetical protein